MDNRDASGTKGGVFGVIGSALRASVERTARDVGAELERATRELGKRPAVRAGAAGVRLFGSVLEQRAAAAQGANDDEISELAARGYEDAAALLRNKPRK